jgi:hypothetical protein
MAMVRNGGSKTKGGIYWKKGKWDIVTVQGNDGTLPGTEDIKYVRIPGIVFGPLALILGLGFYLFLPLIGFVMLLSVIVKKIGGKLAPSAPQPHSDKPSGSLRVPPGPSRPAQIRTGGGLS